MVNTPAMVVKLRNADGMQFKGDHARPSFPQFSQEFNKDVKDYFIKFLFPHLFIIFSLSFLCSLMNKE